MTKVILALIFCTMLPAAHSFEAGTYILHDIEDTVLEFNNKEIPDLYLNNNLKNLFKKYSPHEVVNVFQIFPALMGVIHHFVFYKSSQGFGFCLFDIYAETKEEVTQCGRLVETSSPIVWKAYFLENGTEIFGGTLTYKGKH